MTGATTATILPLAASGIEGIFFLVIAVVWVIIQIASARKKEGPTASSPQQKPEEDYTDYSSPEDELRKFLQRLGQPAPPPAPPPLPAAPARTSSDPARGERTTAAAAMKKARERELPKRRPAPPPVVYEAQAIELPPVQESLPDAYATSHVVIPSVPDVSEIAPYQRIDPIIMTSLSSRGSLRKVLVLKEILGAPLALRSASDMNRFPRT